MKQNTKTLIIEKAYEMFATYGFEKTSLSMIASELGITKPAIYYHFTSKQALKDTIFDLICDEIEGDFSFETANLKRENFVDYVIDIGLKMVEEQRADPYFNQLFTQYILEMNENEAYKQRLEKIQSAFFTNFRKLLTYGAEIGAVTEQDINIKADTLALLYDNISNYLLNNEQLNFTAIWTQAVRNILGESR